MPPDFSGKRSGLGYAAVQAAAQWLFEPPKSGGKPAVVRLIVPFVFKIKPPVMESATGGPAAHSDASQNQGTAPQG